MRKKLKKEIDGMFREHQRVIMNYIDQWIVKIDEEFRRRGPGGIIPDPPPEPPAASAQGEIILPPESTE